MNPWLQKTVTLVLAAFYALIASCGHGLHDHAGHSHGGHCHGPHQCSSSHSHTSDQDCCGHHDPFEKLRAALADEPSKNRTDGQPLLQAAESSHGLHDCVACQLLSQFEVGFSLSVPHVGVWLQIARPPVLDDSLFSEAIVRCFNARGPPVLS